MLKILTLATLTLSLVTTPSYAFQHTQKQTSNFSDNLTSQIILIGQKQYKLKKTSKHHNANQGKLSGNGRHVKDTCPGGDHACINQLKIDCDAAKGGLSTQPDGGVDCYVVGIHDQ